MGYACPRVQYTRRRGCRSNCFRIFVSVRRNGAVSEYRKCGYDGTSAKQSCQFRIGRAFINIQQYVEDHNMQESISVKQGDDSKQGTGSDSSDSTEKPYSQDGDKSKNIYIQFNNNVLFMPDEAVLRDDSYEVMEFLASACKRLSLI